MAIPEIGPDMPLVAADIADFIHAFETRTGTGVRHRPGAYSRLQRGHRHREYRRRRVSRDPDALLPRGHCRAPGATWRAAAGRTAAAVAQVAARAQRLA